MLLLTIIFTLFSLNSMCFELDYHEAVKVGNKAQAEQFKKDAHRCFWIAIILFFLIIFLNVYFVLGGG